MSTAKLGEYFAKLPACKADRTNWIFFRDCFVLAADVAGLSDHLDGGPTGQEPMAPAIVDPAHPMAEETRVNNEYLNRQRFWKSEQAIVKQGIASTIPDSLFLKVKGGENCKGDVGKGERRIREEVKNGHR
jgi:hypothetical protein